MADVEQDKQNLLSPGFTEDSDEILLDTEEILTRNAEKVDNMPQPAMSVINIPPPAAAVYPSYPHTSVLNDVSLEGDITVPGAPQEEEEGEFNTLDEPVRDTIMRDLNAVGKKFFHVLYPKESRSLLREWDLWGPLILCVFIAMMLQSSQTVDKLNKGGPQFAEVFLIYWVGSVIVTLNIKLLGGSISFFQSVCVLGYCVLPLTIALIICRVILIASHQTTVLFAIRCVVVLAAFIWSTFASTAFLSESQPAKRKALAIYPILLFYFVISWLVISHTHH